MKKTKVYISLPISGHDIEQVKKRAEEVKQRIENDRVVAITPSTCATRKTVHTPTTWGATSKP